MKSRKEGRREAHTPEEIAETRADGADGADPRGFAAQIAAERAAAEGLQLGLLDDDEDLPDVLPIGGTRNRMAAARGRGRPRGAGNKRSELMRDYLLKRGYTHPMEALAAIGSASVDEVAAELAGGEDRYQGLGKTDRIDVRAKALHAIVDANRALLPFFESKRPVEVQVEETRRSLFLIGQIDERQAETAFLSLGGESQILFEDQALSGTAPVRGSGGTSHDGT